MHFVHKLLTPWVFAFERLGVVDLRINT